MTLKLRKALVVVGALATIGGTGVVVDTATAQTGAPAEAAANKVCHNGARTDAPVEVYESGTGDYELYPGDCTSGDVPIIGVRPLPGWKMAYKVNNGPLKVATRNGNQWTPALQQNINITTTYTA